MKATAGTRHSAISGDRLRADHARGMALVAADTVVHVPVHLWMTEVVGVVASVATCTLKDGIVTRINVAGRAHIVR